MEFVIEILKTVVLGIIQGITEWLPISSTGHMILADAFLNLNQPKEFMDMFYVVIQLGSILREILAPEQYEVERNMADGYYETSFRLDWYRLSLPALAEPFARDLFSRHTFYAEIPERYTVAPLDVPDTDAVLITEEGGFGQDVLLCRGTVVFYLRYYGDQELSAHPELLAELAQFDGR